MNSNINYTGRISYIILRQIIFDYIKDNQGIELSSTSIEYLEDKLRGDSRNNQPFFIMNNEFGETRFDISNEDILKIFKSYLAEKNYELSNIEFGNYNIMFSYRMNSNIKNEINKDKFILDIDFNGSIKYDKLRQIIFDYYKKNQGMELSSTSMGYLEHKLRGDSRNNQPFFIMNNEFGETRFDISKEDIQKILESYFESKNYELKEVKYGNNVEFKYRFNNKKVEPEKENEVKTDDFSKMQQDSQRMSLPTSNDVKHFELPEKTKIKNVSQSTNIYEIAEAIQELNPTAEIRVGKIGLDSRASERFYSSLPIEKLVLPEGFYYNEKNGVTNKNNTNSGLYCSLDVEDLSLANEEMLMPKKSKNSKENFFEKENPKSTMNDSMNELARMAREKRKFTILQRERAINEAQKIKNKSSLMAGICILGAAVAAYFNGQDMNQVLQTELNSIYSWRALGHYLQDLGPITTLLSAGAAGFISKYLNNSKRLKDAQNAFEDFNASLEISDELGGNENVKSR